MTSSLVGSEMCIRDRGFGRPTFLWVEYKSGSGQGPGRVAGSARTVSQPVSYTHLTLPTICSV
eukprot:11761171-Prorocentrum_lima.AAC.1